MLSSPLPILRLKPKADARNIRHGFPWVYDDQVVADRRTRKIAAGTLGILESTDRAPLGLVAVNPGSKIFARILDQDPEAQIDQDWFAGHIRFALAQRERLYDQPFYRLIHAEADRLPGVIVDRFGEVLVVQPNAAWAENLLDAFVEALLDVTGVTAVYKSASGRARKLEGLDDRSDWVVGSVDAPIDVPMNGAIYKADLTGGQKTGLFFDQRENHAFAARLGKGGRVLDLFSHVGGFGLAALAAGASEALCVDGSASALELAEAGGAASGFGGRLTTLKGDAFAVTDEMATSGEQFDVVIADPPAFAPNKQALHKGLRAYERVALHAAKLVRPGGYLGLCSCSHAAELSKFRQASIRGIGRAGREGQLIWTGGAGPDHPTHPRLAESSYLKALFFRLA